MQGIGGIYTRNGSPFWWCHFSLHGKVWRKSTGVPVGDDPDKSKPKAERFLRAELDKRGAAKKGGKPLLTVRQEKATISELLGSLECDLRLRGKLNSSVKTNLKALGKQFGFMLAVQLTADDVSKYIETLLADEYRPATVNRRTQLLQQAYNLAIRERRLNEKPYIRHLSEAGNTRKGFIYRAELDRLLAHLPEHLGDVALFGYLSAWRRNEILTLEWGDVQGDTIRLRAEHSKEREARSLALEGELADVIERRRKAKNGSLVFHHNGAAIVDFRKSWKTACKMAGVSGKLFHDLRRSGVRDMIRSGVAPHVAMSVSGHKTTSMLGRYSIISEADQRAALIRTEEFRQAERAKQLEKQRQDGQGITVQ